MRYSAALIHVLAVMDHAKSVTVDKKPKVTFSRCSEGHSPGAGENTGAGRKVSVGEPRVHYKYKLREFSGDWDIGLPYDKQNFGTEVTVLTDRQQAEELRHFMEWRLQHPTAELAAVLPLVC